MDEAKDEAAPHAAQSENVVPLAPAHQPQEADEVGPGHPHYIDPGAIFERRLYVRADGRTIESLRHINGQIGSAVPSERYYGEMRVVDGSSGQTRRIPVPIHAETLTAAMEKRPQAMEAFRRQMERQANSALIVPGHVQRSNPAR